MLPRGVLTEDVIHNPNLSRLLLYLLSRTKDSTVEFTVAELSKEFGWSRQQVRTMIEKLKSTNKITSKSTNKITTLIFDNKPISHKRQPANQPINQPTEQPQNTPHPVSYIPAHTLDFQVIVDTLRNDTSWRESIQRNIGLTEAQIDDALERYPDHCITQGETKKTLKEAKYHIANWLRRQKYSIADSRYETKQQDRFSERRGTDPTANRPEDYSATL